MTTFALTIPGASSVTITDAACLAGLTAARTAANNAMPATVSDASTPPGQIPNPALYATDAAYLDHILQGTAAADIPRIALRATRSFAMVFNGVAASSLPPDPDAPPPPASVTPPVIVQTPALLSAYAKNKQQAVMMAGTLINGMWVDTSIEGLVMLGGAVQLAQQQPNTNINWVSNGAAISLTPAQIIGLGVAIGNRTQSTFTTLGTVLAAITGGSITTPSQIDAAAWPS